MSEQNKVDAIINGDIYTIVGVENKEYIRRVAEYIDSKYKEIIKEDISKSISAKEISILASVNVADDYMKMVSKYRILESSVTNLAEENKILKGRLERANTELVNYRRHGK